jgi:hypothetical protein
MASTHKATRGLSISVRRITAHAHFSFLDRQPNVGIKELSECGLSPQHGQVDARLGQPALNLCRILQMCRAPETVAYAALKVGAKVEVWQAAGLSHHGSIQV